MIQLIVGGKGSGKTKKMIDMINESAKTTPGNIVCIEKSMKLTYDINYKARLIDVDEYSISGYEMLYGFIAGELDALIKENVKMVITVSADLAILPESVRKYV